MRYLDRTRKDITLPSGAQIEIRKLNVFNEPFVDTSKKGDQERGVGMALFILTNKVGPLRFDGESSVIVNKKDRDCEKGEIALEVIEQEDAQAIVDGVMAFSGLDRAGREASKTFPAGQETSGSTPPAGVDLRVPADGAAKAATG